MTNSAIPYKQSAASGPDTWMAGMTKSILLLLLGVYRTLGTSLFGGSCRFEPSCSEYAVEAVHKHTPWMAIRLIAKRLAKCRPGGPYGDDPVPCPDCRIEKEELE